jgi:hypothetical protein
MTPNFWLNLGEKFKIELLRVKDKILQILFTLNIGLSMSPVVFLDLC